MKKIQLKQVLRNKRFVLFTIILPIGWYIFFYQLQKGISQISGFILLNPALQAIVSRTIYGIKASYN